jgi:predicted AAA+ superfamily ATPase
MYFIDTGLLCYLLSIKSVRDLKSHPNYEHIFKTFIISEFYKKISHITEIPPLYYWRDKKGREVDLIVDLGEQHLPITIHAGKSYSENFKKDLSYWLNLRGNSQKKGLIIYGGNQSIGRSFNIPIIPWWML